MIAVLLAAAGVVMPQVAFADCEANGPGLLALYLSGRTLGNAIHDRTVDALVRQGAAGQGAQSIAALDAAVASFNTQLWGLYWVALYGRRLHEVLDQLDKPPGPVTQYYHRWDAAQMTASASTGLQGVAAVRVVLAQASGLGTDQVRGLSQHLQQISEQLEDCSEPAASELRP